MFVLFYRRESVKVTCAVRDPVRRWTDDFSIPVLALLVLLVMNFMTLEALA
jgi:hypothetical protein